MMSYPLTALATLFIIGVYFWTLMKVGNARGQYNVQAPAITGPEEFNRVFRVAENTKEQIVLFLPVLWLFALSYQVENADCYVAILGAAFGIGRIIYALAYYREAKKRTTGFMIGFISFIIAFIGAAYGVISLIV